MYAVNSAHEETASLTRVRVQRQATVSKICSLNSTCRTSLQGPVVPNRMAISAQRLLTIRRGSYRAAVRTNRSELQYVANMHTFIGVWLRCLVKMVGKVRHDHHKSSPDFVDHGQSYRWYEMSFLSRWDGPDRCRILCIDTPTELRSELHAALGKQSALYFQDPFAMHRNLIDLIINLYAISVWRLRDHVRMLEKVNTLH